MKIIGCDFHTRYQQIAMMDEATGELIERRLDHQKFLRCRRQPPQRRSYAIHVRFGEPNHLGGEQRDRGNLQLRVRHQWATNTQDHEQRRDGGFSVRSSGP